MRGRQDTNLRRDWAQIGHTAAVDTHTLINDAATHRRLGERPHCLAHRLVLAGELGAVATQSSHCRISCSIESGVAL